MNEHNKPNTENRVISQDLGPKCRVDIANAAAKAVILDMSPLSFAESRLGMANFCESLFKAGQTVPYGVVLTPCHIYLLVQPSKHH